MKHSVDISIRVGCLKSHVRPKACTCSITFQVSLTSIQALQGACAELIMITGCQARCSGDAEIGTKFTQHSTWSAAKIELKSWVKFGLKSIKTLGWSFEGFFDWSHDIRYTTDKHAVAPGMMVLLVLLLFSFSTCSSSSPPSDSPSPHRDSRGLPANGVSSRYCTLCYWLEDAFVYLQFGEQVEKSGAQEDKESCVWERWSSAKVCCIFMLKKGKTW